MEFDIKQIISFKVTWIIIFLVLYFLTVFYRAKNIRNRKKTEIEKLIEISWRLDTSEYRIFEIASDKWSIPKERIEKDFKIYLNRIVIPFYVRDFIRYFDDEKLRGEIPVSEKYNSV